MKFTEIWYINASQQTKRYKKLFLDFGLFLPFLTKKQPKKKNWQNPNRLMKFSEICYVDASQQKNDTKKVFFGFRLFLVVF